MRENTQETDIENLPVTDEMRDLVAQQLELFAPEEIVRPDYNIGKYATMLFASPHLKNLDDERTFTWKVKAAEDETMVASITIHPQKNLIVPTTTTFKVLMALIQIWRMQGSRPSGSIYFSDRQLAEVAGWGWSGHIAKRIRDHIRILKGTTIDWVMSYKRGDMVEQVLQQMSLIDSATTIQRSQMFKEQKFQSVQTVRLNPDLVHNMLNNVVRPINFESLRQIRSDASARLYMMLDLYLAKKTIWERRSKALLMADLGYEGKRYENRGERKRTLKKLIADLDGKELATGKLALAMAETADKSDWKLVARRVKRIVRSRKPIPRVRDADAAEYLADELLARFEGVPKAGAPKRGFMIFLCVHYPENLLRDALSRAKADYQGSVRKSVGAIFRYEVEKLVRERGDLTWYKD